MILCPVIFDQIGSAILRYVFTACAHECLFFHPQPTTAAWGWRRCGVGASRPSWRTPSSPTSSSSRAPSSPSTSTADTPRSPPGMDNGSHIGTPLPANGDKECSPYGSFMPAERSYRGSRPRKNFSTLTNIFNSKCTQNWVSICSAATPLGFMAVAEEGREQLFGAVSRMGELTVGQTAKRLSLDRAQHFLANFFTSGHFTVQLRRITCLPGSGEGSDPVSPKTEPPSPPYPCSTTSLAGSRRRKGGQSRTTPPPPASPSLSTTWTPSTCGTCSPSRSYWPRARR